jgi:hypothetical protein
LRAVEGAKPGEIGVSFEPHRSAPAKRADGHAFVDVAGTLWLDRSSGRLLRADFHYTGIEAAARDANVGGGLEFLYLPGGPTVISSWRIRVPRLSITRELAASPSTLGTAESSRLQTRVREEVKELWQFGGELSRAKLGDSLYQRRADAEVHGVVSEGRGLPAREAAVLLEGTSYATLTDSLGRFHLSGILPGDYRLLVRSRVAALFGLAARPAASISVHAGESAQTQLEATTALEAVAARCGKQARGTALPSME